MYEALSAGARYICISLIHYLCYTLTLLHCSTAAYIPEVKLMRHSDTQSLLLLDRLLFLILFFILFFLAIESLLLLDRLLFLRQLPGVEAAVIAGFMPEVSPRNLVLTARRRPS